MDNQLTDKDISIQRWILIGLAVLLTVILVVFGVHQFRYSDPYVKSVLSRQGDVDQGRFIFQMNCSSCHGIYGDGQVGPSLRHVSSRKSSLGLIHQVTSGETPPMPQFQPSPQEMADLLKYLESL
ncbi:cytochrome c [Oscillatoria sp. FACHB-1407]|uniref:c-type cytochrome n=1 Tax=Oscillatoria sp. FACHB-1407 TaxID=2692847 RepID=UPI00168A20E4|nr:cytochrome c [Oscillatoria sp. FACHB-1407]MBD2465163.1 cytochrome c [Oscillatoria sp. FACHB-1407]